MIRAGQIERRLKLHDLRVLLSVVECRSMSKAAERLATSQSAVSRTIADLEHAIGVRLLDRGVRGVEPTPFGEALVRRGLVAFDELRQGIVDIEALLDPTAGALCISASIAVATGFVSVVVDRLTRRYPRLSFEVLAVDTATAFRYLEDRKVDIAVIHLIREVPETHFSIDRLGDDMHVVGCGVNGPWLRRRGLVLGDLIDAPWTLPPPDSPFGSVVADAFRAERLPLPPAAVIGPFPVRSALVATGRYLTMVPRLGLGIPSKQSTLKALPIALPATRRPVGFVTLTNRTLSPIGTLFIRTAREVSRALASR